MSARSIDQLIISLAGRYDGLVPTASLRAQGVTSRSISRREDSGLLVACLPGVRLLGQHPLTPLRLSMAAVLSMNRGHVSHVTALAHHGATVRSLAAHVTSDRQFRLPGIVRHEQPAPHPRDLGIAYDLPISRPWLAVVESAAILQEDALAVAMDSLVQSGATSVARIQRSADNVGWFRGRAVLIRLLDDRINGLGLVRSFLEQQLDSVLRHARLPPGVRNFRVTLPNGARRELDRAWPELRVGLEAHSWKHHSNTTEWGATMTRDRQLTALGWRMFPVVVADTRNPSRLLDDLRTVLDPGFVSQVS